MPYTIQTQDGIEINNIPDDVPSDSPQLKAKVAQMRAQREGGQQPQPTPDLGPTVGGLRDIDKQFAETTTLQDQPDVVRETIRGPITTPGAKVQDTEEFIFRGLTEDQKSAIIAKNTGRDRSGHESLNFAPARKAADFERLRNVNPVLAEVIEGMGGLESFVIGAGSGFDTLLRGVGISDQQDEFTKVATKGLVESSLAAAAGKFTGEVAPFVVPGGAAARIASVPLRAATSGAIAAIEGGVTALGEGKTGKEALASAALTGTIGALTGGLVKAQPPKPSVIKTIKEIFPESKQSPLKEEIKRLISEDATDNKTAKFILDGQGKVKADPVARESIKQGFDEGVIAAVKGSTPKDRSIMLRMVEILKKGKANKRFAAENRPTDIVGDSVLARFKSVVSSNREAGKRLEKIAQSLKGKSVNFDTAVSGFLDDLEGIGVKVGDDLKPNFSGSDIEGLAAPENIIKRIVKRMTSGQNIDAHDVHRMKKFIDEQVTFGKTAEGLGGKTEGILKSLRRNLDQALDSKFAKYNEVNTKFADTITALDGFKDAAGAKFNPLSDNADKFVGTLSRRLLSNVQSRVALIDSLNEMQKVAIKYGAKFDDDILTQAMFADELARMFGSAATTSFEGGIEKGVQTAIKGKAGVVDLAGEALTKGAKVLRGVNEVNALKNIEALLRRGAKR